ncbi:STAS domain-containing protein [Actinophytocola gossypii]|uniref:Anti-sigma factor antagonist n=1 Tax=Actinophytocola gossypii TaxID=2812003 RepID=A0ABT2J738_9PSEU|nr:STAS domain-containing protein [Actinophytocola gossypii]MCT2583429.1 STAS domain-containing protein [Actinophytocola gossypii]
MFERPDELVADYSPLRVRRVPYRADLEVVTVAGEVDLRTAPELARALRADQQPLTVVDLTRVTFMSAAGLGILVQAAEQANERGRRLGLVAHDRVALRMLRMSGVAAAIPTFVSLSDAVRELAAQVH